MDGRNDSSTHLRNLLRDDTAAAVAALDLPVGTYDVAVDEPVTHRGFVDSLADALGFTTEPAAAVLDPARRFARQDGGALAVRVQLHAQGPPADGLVFRRVRDGGLRRWHHSAATGRLSIATLTDPRSPDHDRAAPASRPQRCHQPRGQHDRHDIEDRHHHRYLEWDRPGLGGTARRCGFRVFAGVRKETDAQSLRAEHPDIELITLDVTDTRSIATTNTRLEATLAGRDGLVKNAGIGVTGPMECIVLDELLADAVLRGQILARHTCTTSDGFLTGASWTSASPRCGPGTALRLLRMTSELWFCSGDRRSRCAEHESA